MKRKGQQLPNSPGIPGGYGKSKRYKNCCYCEVPIPIPKVTREHIIPKHKGGRITRPCCWKCNHEKGGLDLLDYAILMIAQLKNLLGEKSLENYKEVKKLRRKIKNCILYLKLLYPEDYDIL